MNKPLDLFGLLIAASLALCACQPNLTEVPEAASTQNVQPPAEPTAAPTIAPTATSEPPPTLAPTESPIGSAEQPIKVVFSPVVEADVIVAGGEVLAQALSEATGLHFEVFVPTSYAAAIEEMCVSPTSSMGFNGGLAYVIANQLCGVEVAFKAVRAGYSVNWSEVLVARDSDIDSLDDLNGLRWAYPDASSTSGYMAPLVMFQQAGITPGDTLEAGDHNSAVSAVYNGEADFATTFYRPYQAPDGAEPWSEGMDPDIPADFIPDCGVATVDDRTQLLCGGYRVQDARANLRDQVPDIIQRLRILAISPAIPNDALAFGPEFPDDLRQTIMDALIAFSQTDAWDQSIGSPDLYGWTGIELATDEEYDSVRLMVEAVGLTLDDLGP
jgi:phosphonate transport system substrate-binding protein